MAGFRVRYEAFSGWTKTFTDPRLCAAIVDQLSFGGNRPEPIVRAE